MRQKTTRQSVKDTKAKMHRGGGSRNKKRRDANKMSASGKKRWCKMRKKEQQKAI